MQVRHGFAGVGTVVEDETVAAFFQAEFLRDFGGFEQQMAEGLMIFGAGFGEARTWFLGNDQNVRRRLRLDVAEGDDQVVFEDDVRRDFAGDDFFKQSFAHADGLRVRGRARGLNWRDKSDERDWSPGCR